MIVKLLALDDMTYPLHTRLLLDYVNYWSTAVNWGGLGGADDRKLLKKLKHPPNIG
jgi:hypothetical protein